MIRNILAIAGRPGLFKIVKQGKNMLPCQKSHNVLTSLASFVKNGGECLKKALFCIIIYYVKNSFERK